MIFLSLTLALMLTASATDAQTAQLRLADPGATPRVGDTLTVEVDVDLGRLRVSGLALHVSLPSPALRLVDASATRPFRPALFAAGVEFANHVVPAAQAHGVSAGAVLLSYAVVLGPGPSRYRSGRGTVATFDVVCTQAVRNAEVSLVDNPAHAATVVLDDGRGQLSLVASGALRLDIAQPAARRASGSWAAVKAPFAP